MELFGKELERNGYSTADEMMTHWCVEARNERSERPVAEFYYLSK